MNVEQAIDQLLQETFTTQKLKFLQQGTSEQDIDNAFLRFKELKNKNLLKQPDNDIDRYKTLDDLASKIKEFETVKTKGEKERGIKQQGSELVHETLTSKIYLITSKQASCIYGAGTRWCISATVSKNYWSHYAQRKAKFYFIINKDRQDNLAKVAVVQYPDGNLEIFDSEDKSVDVSVLKKLDVYDFFQQKGIVIDYQTEEGILKYFDKKGVKYTKNKDGSYDIDGSVDLSHKGLTKLPIKFGSVKGFFHCYYNKLTSLEGAPKSVGEDFSCSYNNLTSLLGAPQNVGGDFYCSSNNLTSLEGGPQNVGGHFSCSNNNLTSLSGAPQNVSGSFDCNNNNLTSLEGGPQNVGGHFSCSNNNLTSLLGAPKSVKGDFSCSHNNKLPDEEIERYRRSKAVKGKIISESVEDQVEQAIDQLLQEDRAARKLDYQNKVSKGFLKVTENDLEQALDISEPYSYWILIQVSKGNVALPRDTEQVTEILKDFDAVKKSSKFTGNKDLFQYKTFLDLKTQVLQSKETEQSKAQVVRTQKETGQRVVVTEDPYEIIEVTTTEAASTVFRGTVWCVKDPDYSKDYLKVGPLYLVLKNNKKYLCYSDKDGFNDIRNHNVSQIDDQLYSMFEKIPSVKKLKQFIKRFNIENYKYTKNSDGSYDIQGDVDFYNMGLTKLPIKFGSVSGKFNCSHNNLISLEGAPKSVGEDFSCSYNNLTSLLGAPQNVGGDFYCSHNNLTSLEGAPKSVGEYFDCSANNLTSLEGALKSVEYFYCSYNNLTSLSGGPQDVGGDFSCHNNNLTSLSGAPQNVSGSFDCNNNNLTSLLGAPQNVGGSFHCSNNNLTSLEGAPKSVGGHFSCSHNNLISLEGAPKSVGGWFSCSYNNLTSLSGGPQNVGGYFDCHNNKLTSLSGGPESVSGAFYCSNNKLSDEEVSRYRKSKAVKGKIREDIQDDQIEKVISFLLERVPETYQSLGHSKDPVILWYWFKGRLLLKKEQSGEDARHEYVWGEMKDHDYFGRFDPKTKGVTMINPFKGHSVPELLLRTLYDKFGDDVKIYEF